MLDFVSRYVSAISLAVFLALAIFNIGYFWKIGIHFIGLADLANLIYTAGLAVTSITIWLVVAAFCYPKNLGPWRMGFNSLAATAFVAWGVWNHDTRSFEPALLQHAATLFGFAIGCSTLLAWLIERRKLNQPFRRELALLMWGLAATVFEAGAFTAGMELTDRITYTVSTKSGVLSNARILRSSSSGFLIEAEDRVMFVPQGEIKDIKSALASEIPRVRP